MLSVKADSKQAVHNKYMALLKEKSIYSEAPQSCIAQFVDSVVCIFFNGT